MNVKTKTVHRQGSKPVWEVTQWVGETRKGLTLFDSLREAKKHVRDTLKVCAFTHRFEIRQLSRSMVMWAADPQAATRNPQRVMSEVHRRRWTMEIEKKVDGKWQKVKGMLVRGSNKHRSSK